MVLMRSAKNRVTGGEQKAEAEKKLPYNLQLSYHSSTLLIRIFNAFLLSGLLCFSIQIIPSYSHPGCEYSSNTAAQHVFHAQRRPAAQPP